MDYYYKSKLLSRLEISRGYFKNFSDINEDTLHNIKVMAKDWLSENKYTGIDKFFGVLNYALFHFKTKHMSFDEKVIFIILVLDPELSIYNEYISKLIISEADIKKEVNLDKKNKLTTMRNRSLNSIEVACRERLGFYHPHILMYEKLYQAKFNKITYFTNIKRDYLNLLLRRNYRFYDFSQVGPVRYQELVATSEKWKELIGDDDYRTTVYNIIKSPGFLELKTVEDKFTFLILVLDYNLEILKIYEENCQLSEIKDQCIAKVGCFDELLVPIEREYHKTFCPEKKISEW